MRTDGKPAVPVYDCLVLSGGGAKGAYGAGVAKAIAAYREKKALTNPICYIGASAGALNAYLLSAGGADELVKFWLSATNRSVLGVRITNAKFQVLCRWTARLFHRHQPFSIYPNKALRRLIHANLRITDLKQPLIIAATDYTQGRLKSFYVSELIDEFVERDRKQPVARQRLRHFRRTENDEQLVNALLASAAIPIFFPPVEVSVKYNRVTETSWYVDGGIGNNTPTREAAYFLRFLEETERGRSGVVYCVKQDTPRTLQEHGRRFSFSEVLTRTLDVYHHVHTDTIVRAWFRINEEVKEQRARVANFTTWLKQQSLNEAACMQIADRLATEFLGLGGSTRRLEAPLVEIEPTSDLGDTLDFNPTSARGNIERGYNDTLKVLQETHKIEEPMRLDISEYDELLNRPIFTRAGK
jgi:predicted patatin/cPLA2 family phospholipase